MVKMNTRSIFTEDAFGQLISTQNEEPMELVTGTLTDFEFEEDEDYYEEDHDEDHFIHDEPSEEEEEKWW